MLHACLSTLALYLQLVGRPEHQVVLLEVACLDTCCSHDNGTCQNAWVEIPTRWPALEPVTKPHQLFSAYVKQ